eukprot:TRINITY_DN9108_c0_g3_i1.p1 TRINITY_DN9108_c0_g3~~TRINITY_DN9108_c0_g3_i1.p1  ORF type:complete len:397 (-),score=46.52 TRINITY_DN9108_c0_g3_i1:252-1442(-)
MLRSLTHSYIVREQQHPLTYRNNSKRIQQKIKRKNIVAQSSSEYFNIQFGAPSAPTEIWQNFANEFRAGFENEVKKKEDEMDAVMAGLYFCAEDDALDTRSTVALPVDSYSQRLDNIVGDLVRWVQSQTDFQQLDQNKRLQRVVEYLFEQSNFTVATESLDQTSPYRLYMHHVLAQRCGTTAALAVLLSGYLLRVKQQGILQSGSWQVGLPKGGEYPVARYPPAQSAESAVNLQYTWMSAKGAIIADIQQLKRSYWPWQWQPDQSHCFFPPAEAFLGEYGRAGTFTSTVGVLQPTGRPFGDLKKAIKATERLKLVYGGIEGGIEGAKQTRDLGILFCHLGDFSGALELLSQYGTWIQGESSGISAEEKDIIKQVQVKLKQMILETAFNKEPAQRTS